MPTIDITSGFLLGAFGAAVVFYFKIRLSRNHRVVELWDKFQSKIVETLT
jgi:hypothetical protein